MIKYVKIEGIHCSHCIETITNELLKDPNIKNVKIKKNIATITYEDNLSNTKIIKTLKSIGYFTKDAYISDNHKDLETKIKLKEFILILGSILLLGLSIEKICGYNIFNVIPTIDTNITYGMLFVTGLLTSIHCISMCGAINLIAFVEKNNTSKRKILLNSGLYNLGRVISYTILGGIVGALGSVFKISSTISGFIILICAIVMLLISLNMLGLIDFHLPKISFFKKRKLSKNAFLIGLLNGFMPCGPLQAMQVYALATGSFFKGALSMFLFSLGTVPLMLGLGLFYNLFQGRKKILLNKIAATLIMILSITMLNRGLLSLNIDLSSLLNNSTYEVATLNDDYQLIEFNLSYNSYQDIQVKKDIPVKIIIHVEEKYLTGCNNEIIIPEFNINKKLEVGDNIIEFIPTKTGVFTYTCWMQMLKNNIKVVS